MAIVSGYQKMKDYIKQSSGYKLLSRWANANTVECDDAQTVQSKIGGITGISSSLTANSSTQAASTQLTNQLYQNIAQVSSEMASLTDSGAITGMDAREDGVYITYVPTAGADAVTKKLGSPELHIPEWRYVLTGGNTFLRFENPGYSKISIGSYTKNGNGSLSISIEGITSAEEFISLGGQTETEYDIKDYPAFRIVLSSLGAINGYLRDISIV